MIENCFHKKNKYWYNIAKRPATPHAYERKTKPKERR
jgi:hypothetical protein